MYVRNERNGKERKEKKSESGDSHCLATIGSEALSLPD